MENPFTIIGGTGVSVEGQGQFDGKSERTFTFNIGQEVATTSNVVFGSLQVGSNSFVTVSYTHLRAHET